ncbi:MAG: pyrroline-5-carboxylate reductase [Phycisphaerales bacterium]
MAQHAECAFIGCGNMGMAVLRGALAAGVLQPSTTLVVDPSEVRRAHAAALGARAEAAPAAAAGARTLILAVKPQVFPEVAPQLDAGPHTLAISVMAGWRSATISAMLGGARVVRTMPNLPAQIGLGMTAVAPTAAATEADTQLAERLFSQVGKVARVAEDHIEAATAVSGSGPAYLFLLAEAQAAAGQALGFDQATARQMVRQTLLGAATLLARGETWADEWRRQVTSPGGTTQAATEVFEAAGLADTVARALRAAEARGRALGK